MVSGGGAGRAFCPHPTLGHKEPVLLSPSALPGWPPCFLAATGQLSRAPPVPRPQPSLAGPSLAELLDVQGPSACRLGPVSTQAA